MPAGPWRVRLTAAAERDFADVVAWTAERFGDGQARRYADAITRAIASLVDGPDQLGSRAREDLPVGLRILPIARRAVRARHVLIYRSSSDGIIEIVRILHQNMDFVPLACMTIARQRWPCRWHGGYTATASTKRRLLMTKRIILALALLLGVSGVALATAGFTAAPASACGDPHTT